MSWGSSGATMRELCASLCASYAPAMRERLRAARPPRRVRHHAPPSPLTLCDGSKPVRILMEWCTCRGALLALLCANYAPAYARAMRELCANGSRRPGHPEGVRHHAPSSPLTLCDGSKPVRILVEWCTCRGALLALLCANYAPAYARAMRQLCAGPFVTRGLRSA